MELENTFEVPAPPARAWEYLLDLERVTPCMPGAELEELPDERTWKGKVSVKLGAVSLSYAATAVIDERDDEARTVVLKANGRETRGRGMAQATINSSVQPAANGGSRVTMHTDLTISGAVAQYGRGMIADVSKRLTDEFADCLQARIAAPATDGEAAAPATEGEATAPATKPISGVRLALWAIVHALRRLVGRIGQAVRSLFRRE